MAVIDIDPNLSHFKPICTEYIISDRIKMDFESITILISTKRYQNRLKTNINNIRTLFSDKFLLKKPSSYLLDRFYSSTRS